MMSDRHRVINLDSVKLNAFDVIGQLSRCTTNDKNSVRVLRTKKLLIVLEVFQGPFNVYFLRFFTTC